MTSKFEKSVLVLDNKNKASKLKKAKDTLDLRSIFAKRGIDLDKKS